MYKALLLSLVLLTQVACGTTGWHTANDSWTGQDKAKHFAVSAVMSAGVAHMAHEAGSPHSAGIGIGVSVAIGGGKEVYDARKGGSGFSWKDLAYDIAGALTGYGVYHMVK